MPYDLFDNYEPITQRLSSDVLDMGTIGGIGQVVYHLFRFQDYDWDYDASGVLMAQPICRKGCEPILYDMEFPTGKEILVGLYNLALRINDPTEEKSYPELILNWCKKNAHPYAVDFMYEGLKDKSFDADQLGFLIEKDGAFSIDQFMRDLERLYHAVSLNLAFDQMCAGNDDPAYNLSEDGRHFSGLPFFEKFRYDPDDTPALDYTPAGGDLLKEMQMDAAARGTQGASDYFVRVPFDEYESLQELMVDIMPSFHLRLKIDPKTRKAVFSADIQSVFDIAWLTLAQKIAEDPPPERNDAMREEVEGVVMMCRFCGKAFIRKPRTRQITCGDPVCDRARKAMNKRNSRAQQKVSEKQSGEA